ncbi:hypothetical protein B0J14DRAFT_706855 [Halenospora varia]|nr:hypothetical protein B0J14DRAFT_706855 [Halenospora varia]
MVNKRATTAKPVRNGDSSSDEEPRPARRRAPPVPVVELEESASDMLPSTEEDSDEEPIAPRRRGAAASSKRTAPEDTDDEPITLLHRATSSAIAGSKRIAPAPSAPAAKRARPNTVPSTTLAKKPAAPKKPVVPKKTAANSKTANSKAQSTATTFSKPPDATPTARPAEAGDRNCEACRAKPTKSNPCSNTHPCQRCTEAGKDCVYVVKVVAKRTSCEACRKVKEKCKGGNPCERCQRVKGGIPCVWADGSEPPPTTSSNDPVPSQSEAAREESEYVNITNPTSRHTACDNCREKKDKCTGGVPCSKCTKDGVECVVTKRQLHKHLGKPCKRCTKSGRECSRGDPCTECAKSGSKCVYKRCKACAEAKIPCSGAVLCQHCKENGCECVYILDDEETQGEPSNANNESGSDNTERPAFLFAAAEFSRRSLAPDLIPPQDARLAAAHRLALAAATETRRQHYLKSSRLQIEALATYRGYRGFRDEQEELLKRGNYACCEWLAQYDVLFSDSQRLLWRMPHHQINAIPEAQQAPNRARKSRLVNWLVENVAARELLKYSEELDVSSIPAEELDNASIFWEPYHTVEELIKMARENQAQVSSKTAPKPLPTGQNYWFMSNTELKEVIAERGIGAASAESLKGNRADFINILQIYDAKHGRQPVVDPKSYSRFHGMSSVELLRLAKKEGFKSKAKASSKEDLIEYLMKNTKSIKDLSEADSEAIAKLLCDDLVASLPNKSDQLSWSKIFAAPKSYQTTWNEGLTATPDILCHLQTAVGRGLQPAPTSNIGLLCGPRALAASLHYVRYDIYRRESPPEGIIPINHDDLMELMFADYNLDAANDESVPAVIGLTGTPTPEYAELLEERLGSLRDENHDDLYREVHTEMLAMNNLSIDQLSLMLELARRAGYIDRHYSIGVVMGSRQIVRNGTIVTIPATAEIHRADAEDAPIVWLHNDGFEGSAQQNSASPQFSHWEGFELPTADVAGLRNINSWGLSVPDAIALPAPLHTRPTRATETPEQRARRETLREKNRICLRGLELSRSCTRCRDEGLRGCNVKKQYNTVQKPCSACKDGSHECSLPEHIEGFSGPKKASEVTMKDILPWARPIDLDKINKWLESAKPEDEPTVKHFLAIISARMSSDQGLKSFSVCSRQFLTPGTEGYQPADTMRQFLMAFCRQGTRAIPTTLGNQIVDPFLSGFINLMKQVTRPNNPQVPVEIHHVLLGIAGFSVGIHGWGDRSRGYFKFLLDADAANNNNNHFENSTYIVVVVEPRVVDGSRPCSIYPPGPPVAGGDYHGYFGKYIAKFKLRSLVDRAAMRTVEQALSVRGLPVPPRPAYYEAHWDDDARNDRFLDAMGEEWGWRANQYDGTTVPTEATIQARNLNRDRRWN